MNLKSLHKIGTIHVSLLLLLCVIYTATYSQQEPKYTQYMFNKMVYNPAYAGTDRQYCNVTVLYRNQWVGWGSKYVNAVDAKYVAKSPVTESFSIHSPIPTTDFGAGLYVVNDLVGFNQFTTFNLAISYKKDFTIGTLHFGVNGGMTQGGISGEWRPPEPGIDNQIPPATQKYDDMTPNLGAGLYFFSPRYYVGLSAQHLLPAKYQWENSQYSVSRIYYITGGVNFLLPNNPDIQLEPSLLYKIDPGRNQYEANLKALYRQRFWAGFTYRQNAIMALLVGMQISPVLKVGYSYDYMANEMRRTQSGTHEVMLDYIFKVKITRTVPPKIIIWTPRFL